MPIKLNSSGGGSVTLDAPVTASNYTVTVPASSGTVATLASVTNNGVVYINSSGQATSGSGLVFDGSNLTAIGNLRSNDGATNTRMTSFGGIGFIGTTTNHPVAFQVNDSEQMRLTSTGLGIGTSTPNANTKLDVAGPTRSGGYTVSTLPTGVVGARAYVTDAVTAVFMAVPTGGGSVKTPVFYNGSNWVCG